MWPGNRESIHAIAINQTAAAVPIAIQIQRALVVGHRHDDMFLPRLFGRVPRILEPPRLLAWEINDDQILPSVIIEVLGPIHERIAVGLDVEAVGLFRDNMSGDKGLLRPIKDWPRSHSLVLIPDGTG